MALPTFVSQNIGAGEYERAKKGAAVGTISSMILAELVGILDFIWAPYAMRIFVNAPEAIEFGVIHCRTTALFFFLLAFSHCAAEVMRGCGKSFMPMAAMLAFWCGVRILYVSIAIQIVPCPDHFLGVSADLVLKLRSLFRVPGAHGLEKAVMEERKKGTVPSVYGVHGFCTRGLLPPAGEGMRRPGRPPAGS